MMRGYRLLTLSIVKRGARMSNVRVIETTASITLLKDEWDVVIATMTSARDAEIGGYTDDIIYGIEYQLERSKK